MTIVETIDIAAPSDVVFDAYVHHIDRWWVRRGAFRYSFAPEATEPNHIRFEAAAGGRFYETFADGTEYTIGHIVGWEPPRMLRYTWKAPHWPVETAVTVRFTEDDDSTTVEVTHDGFGVDGVPDLGDGYAVGLLEILGGLKAWVQDRAA